MKCQSCSKHIPDGFTDCPWCGSTPASRQLLPGSPFDAAKSTRSTLRTVLLLLDVAVCFVIVVYLSLMATVQTYGPLRNYNPYYLNGAFVGRCVASYAFPGIFVFLYYKIRKKSVTGLVQLAVISGWAVFWTIFAFAGAAESSRNLAMRRQATSFHRIEDPPKRTIAPTKWDPAIKSLYADIRSFHERYLGEVSKLDVSAVPLYTANSFSDAAKMQQAITQLQARMDVSRQFASPEPLLDKMPEYLQQIDASQSEKQKFLEGFDAAARRDLGQWRIVNDNEQNWLQSSVALYRFALSKQGAYSIQGERVVFRQKAVGDDFDRKLELAKLRRMQFVGSHGRYIAIQNKYLAQLGLPTVDLGGGAPPTESSVTKFLSDPHNTSPSPDR
jgi:hypothetical protein